jgi:hypothetical protein
MVTPTSERFHELFATARRRRVVTTLVRSDRPLTRREVARRVATDERRTSEETAEHPDRRIDEVETALHHKHLPALLAVGAIVRGDDDRFTATALGHDLDRADRAFRAVIASGDAERNSPTRRASSGEVDGGRPTERLLLPLSRETVSAVGRLVERDERWDATSGYDEVIRTVAAEASE